MGRFLVLGSALSKCRCIILRIADGLDCRNRTGNLSGLADADKASKKGESSGTNENQRIYRYFNTDVCGNRNDIPAFAGFEVTA